ncbi:MAG: hypothetical protein ACJAWL_002834 [Motiliproteus sp.]|jgi:hypothetical protein
MPRTLLDLSRSYAAGQLDQQAYRQQRLRLIRQLLQATADVTLPVRADGSAAPGVDSTRDAKGSAAPSVDSTRDYTPTRAMALAGSGRRMKAFIAAGLLLSVFVVVAVLGVRPVDGPWVTPARNPEDLVSKAASLAVVQETPLQRHLASMLSQERWTRVQLQQFRRAWQASTEAVLLQTRQDPRYRQLVALLESQVRVLEALDPEGIEASVTDRIRLLEQLRRQVSTVGS